MYARVARFEGLDSSRIDDDIAEMKRQMASSRSGEPPEGAPDGVRTLMETVTRFVHLVDRERGAAVALTFCQTEDDVRRADAALNDMSPPSDSAGRRRGPAEIYEVVLDERFG